MIGWILYGLGALVAIAAPWTSSSCSVANCMSIDSAVLIVTAIIYAANKDFGK